VDSVTLTPTPIYTADSLVRFDQRHCSTNPVLAEKWMRQAGARAFELIAVPVHGFRVLIGPGSNGGDGLVLATLGLRAHRPVAVYAPLGLSTSTVVQSVFKDFVESGGKLCSEADFMHNTHPWVDGLFGVGLNRPLSDAIGSMINQLGSAILALDVPSGLDAQTGAVEGVAVRALTTLTFLGLKPGLFEGQGPRHAGKVWCEDFQQSAAVAAECEPIAWRYSPKALATFIGEVDPMTHKGDLGSVLVIGGEAPTTGAAQLTALASLKAQAGKVWWSVGERDAALAALLRPELMVVPADTPSALGPTLARADVIALGPGLGTQARAVSFFDHVVAAAQPVVLDADALNVMASSSSCLAAFRTQRSTHAGAIRVLTPHPLEALRLLRVVAPEMVAAERRVIAVTLARALSAVVVLKGAASWVADPAGNARLIDAGGPELALPGSGDVLTGMIAAVLAQKRWQAYTVLDRVCFAVNWHAFAGRVLARRARSGHTAVELVEAIPDAFEMIAMLRPTGLTQVQRDALWDEWVQHE